MAGSFPRSVAWVLGGAVCFATFAGLLYAGGAWSRAATYSVTVTAEPGVSWTVSVPRPYGDFHPGATANVEQVVSWDSPHGGMYNLSGNGNGSAWFTSASTYFDLSSPGDVQAMSFGFSAAGAPPAWAARESSNASASIFLTANSFFALSRADDQIECAGSGFSSALKEGWNALTEELGGCTRVFSSVGLAPLSVPFLVGGLVCMYVGWDRGRKFGWAR